MGMWHAWGEMRNSCRVLLESLKGRGCLNDLGIDGRIIILLRNMGAGCGLDSLRSEQVPLARCLEKLSASQKGLSTISVLLKQQYI